jgi:hypothetical protein
MKKCNPEEETFRILSRPSGDEIVRIIQSFMKSHNYDVRDDSLVKLLNQHHWTHEECIDLLLINGLHRE